MVEGQKQIPGKLPRGLVQGKVNKEREERDVSQSKKDRYNDGATEKRGKDATGIEERKKVRKVKGTS